MTYIYMQLKQLTLEFIKAEQKKQSGSYIKSQTKV